MTTGGNGKQAGSRSAAAQKLADRLQHPESRRPIAALSRFVSIPLTLATFLAAMSLAVEHGFYEPPLSFLNPELLHGIQFSVIGLFVLSRLLRFAAAPNRLQQLRTDWLDYVFIFLGAAILLIESNVNGVSILQAGAVYVLTVQTLIVVRLAVQLVRFNLEMAQRQVHPTRLLIGSFGVLVILGTILLALPKASRPILWGDSTHYVFQHLLNCLFTATSATCVTGLVVYDTGQDFTLFGQIVILVLMQLGGLGIMIFGGVIGVLMGRQISLRESLVLQDAVSKNTVGQITTLIRFIFVTTFLAEALGALCLYSMWDPQITSPAHRWFLSIFHSVSAFCNAGFCLEPDSMIAHRKSWQLYGAIMPLILVGGFGFPVIYDLFVVVRSRIQYGWARSRRRMALGVAPVRLIRPKKMSLSLHTKIVLSSSLVLVLGGAVLLLACESPSVLTTRYAQRVEGARIEPPSPESMSGMGPLERTGAALFQSVTARTAGFNSARTDLESMSPAAHFLICVLMFIGGSPASTAGGVKTATVSVLILAVFANLRRREQTEVFARTIGRDIITRAAVLVIGMFVVVTVVTFALAVTEDAPLEEVLFESVSACGTVGLSTGLTPRLTGLGKVVIMLAMFAGRLGPLTFLIALAGRTRPIRYEYPQETVTIG